MTADQQKLNAQENREKADDFEIFEPPKKVEYLTAKQLAQVLQISESTIHKLRRAGKIPAVMLTARLIRFNLKEVKHALRPTHASNHQSHDPAPAAEPSPQLSLFDDENGNVWSVADNQ
ncbi:MAG: helix-turn-helix domain-containing protein [Acidobacteria bacterium]|nr:helix-turn-helix domain-containing protein [Acidobacteriota bacterium]